MEVIRRKQDKAPAGVVVIILIIIAAVIGGIYAYQNNPSIQLKKALSSARQSYDNRDYSQAAAYAEKALELDSTSADAYSILIDSYAADQNYDAMSAALSDAGNALDENETTRLTQRAVAHLNEAAREAEENNDTDTAVSLYERVVSLAGSNTSLSDPASEKIAALSKESDDDDLPDEEDTIASLEKALEDDPDSEETLSALAKAQLDAGRTDDAITTLNRLIALDGTNEDAVEELASIYISRKDYDRALLILNRAYKETGSQTLNTRIISCMAAKAQGAEGRTAISLWQAVLRKNPKYVEAYSAMSDLYYALADYNKAVHILEEGYEITGDTLLYRQLSTLEKTLAQEGITIDGGDEKNPVEELVRYAEENNYADALKVMARKEVQDLVTKKKDEADDRGRITLSAEDFPDAKEAAAADTDTEDTDKEAASAGSTSEKTAADTAKTDKNSSDKESDDQSSAGDTKASSSESSKASGDGKEEDAADADATLKEEDTPESSEDASTSGAGKSSTAKASSDSTGGTKSSEEDAAEEEEEPATITVVINEQEKRFYIDTEDGTQVTAYWPAVTDNAGRVVIGQYGEDIYGNANYELADGTVLTAYEYLVEYSP